MPKDYKGYNSKPKKTRRRKAESKKPLLWFSVVAIVILAAFVAYWYLPHDLHFSHKKSNVTPVIAAPKKSAEQTAAIQKPAINFEFYNILTKQTVTVPNPTLTTAPSPAATTNYIVQVASLKNAKVADSMRAKLALDGFNVQVRAVVNSSGNTWYRIQIGPFNNYNDASDTLNNLRKHHSDGMIKTIKP